MNLLGSLREGERPARRGAARRGVKRGGEDTRIAPAERAFVHGVDDKEAYEPHACPWRHRARRR